MARVVGDGATRCSCRQARLEQARAGSGSQVCTSRSLVDEVHGDNRPGLVRPIDGADPQVQRAVGQVTCDGIGTVSWKRRGETHRLASPETAHGPGDADLERFVTSAFDLDVYQGLGTGDEQERDSHASGSVRRCVGFGGVVGVSVPGRSIVFGLDGRRVDAGSIRGFRAGCLVGRFGLGTVEGFLLLAAEPTREQDANAVAPQWRPIEDLVAVVVDEHAGGISPRAERSGGVDGPGLRARPSPVVGSGGPVQIAPDGIDERETGIGGGHGNSSRMTAGPWAPPDAGTCWPRWLRPI